jgi:hypothetical protein
MAPDYLIKPVFFSRRHLIRFQANIEDYDNVGDALCQMLTSRLCHCESIIGSCAKGAPYHLKLSQQVFIDAYTEYRQGKWRQGLGDIQVFGH